MWIEKRGVGQACHPQANSVIISYLRITVLPSIIEASLQSSSQVTAGGGTILLCHFHSSLIQQSHSANPISIKSNRGGDVADLLLALEELDENL